jgi:hypothetical protein
MRDLQIFMLVVEVYFNLELVMLLPRLGRGSAWYGVYFASVGAYGVCNHVRLLSLFPCSRPGEIWIRAVSYKERLTP